MNKIDVLAVMDDAAAILTFDDNTVTARILGEARAAVAELIEADRLVDRRTAEWATGECSSDDVQSAHALRRDALSRIDGAA